MDSGGTSTSSKITPSGKWSIADLDENILIIQRFIWHEQVIAVTRDFSYIYRFQ